MRNSPQIRPLFGRHFRAVDGTGFSTAAIVTTLLLSVCGASLAAAVTGSGPEPPSLRPDAPPLKPALQLWLKADGRPWQDGQSVALWEDLSGRGHDLAATAGARREGTGAPAKFIEHSSIAGFPAVRFDGKSGLGGNGATAPDIVGDAEFTMLLVLRLRGEQPTSEGLLAGFGEPAHPANPGRPRCAVVGVQSGGGGRAVFVGGWGNDARPVAGWKLLEGPPLILTLVKTRGALNETARFYFNGTDAGSLSGHRGVPDFGRRDDLGFFMGRARTWARGFAGDVAEVALYNRALSTDERRALEAHFSAKFRIPLEATEEARRGTGAAHPLPATTKHWAFQPMSKPTPPLTGMHPIDAFVMARWREAGVEPAPQADARTLVRRLYFDLHGLPPTPPEMEAALKVLDPWNDAAWARLIDELLASPRYGERWGRHWLDLARYADTAGDNADYPVPEARLYRDYVIDALNADKPYDQFVREQLAGDLLAAAGPRERYAERIIATGFLALSRRYATGPYEFWHLTLEDTIDTVGQAFLGLSLKCARCHDHKYDPVTQRDYYALYGIFESTEFPWPGAEEFQSKKLPRTKFTPLLPAAEAAPRRQAHDEAARRLPAELEKLEKEDPLGVTLAACAARVDALTAASAPAAEIETAKRERDAARKKLEAKKAALRAPFESATRMGYPPEVPSAYAVHEGTPRPAVLQRRGDPGQPGPVVPHGVPAFLASGVSGAIVAPEFPATESGRRQLAEWLIQPEHPLTARVLVNRVWQHHFGRGLVATPSNFGTRGAAPAHPVLLDWLAREFVAQHWSVKSLHRLILTSRAWRLASTDDPNNSTRDPANALLWHQERRRLDAEAIRDGLLAVSGRLDLTRPGPHPFKPVPEFPYTQHNQFRDFYPSTHRSVYLMTPRLQRHPFLALFDAPDANTTAGSRTSAIVPAQALYLMNSAEMTKEAEAFARRLLAEPPEQRIARAYALAFQRPPTPQEIARANEFLTDATQMAQADELTAWTSLGRTLLAANEFFYVD